jgi:hypothetical protein
MTVKGLHTKLNHLSLLLMVVAVSFLNACKKNEEEKPAPPIIEFKAISHSVVEQYNNSVQITLGYEDYQGDLGRQDPDDYALRILDARLANYDWYHVPPMTPNNEELHIKGNYIITLDPLFLLGTGEQESTTFTIQLQDNAGNWSNTITTPVVLVVDSL